MPTEDSTNTSDVATAPTAALDTSPRRSARNKLRLAKEAKEAAEATAASTTTQGTLTMASDPTSSHAGEIHETTRVGLTLVRQATDELDLDAKFDAQPRNQKAFLRELTERSMDCCWEAHGLLSFTVNGTQMNLLEDHGKIPMAIIQQDAVTARAGSSTAFKNRTQRAKHLYKCLSKLVSTKVQDSLDPYMKEINQDGPMYFKHIMTEVASNPSPEAEARDIRQTLSRANLLKKIREVKNDVKTFNLYMHAQLSKLASYTTTTKEDLDADIMATYRSIPCSAFRAEIRSLDKERRDKNWDVKRILAEAVVKFNDVCTNEEWVMDLKDTEPPPNPLALPAYQRDTKSTGSKDSSKYKKPAKGDKPDGKTKSWKYIAPAKGEANTKMVENAKKQQEKRYWCDHVDCHRWTLSHTTEDHGSKKDPDKDPPKAENLKLQGSLKTFLSAGKAGNAKLSKKERKQLQALLTTMNHNADSSAAEGSVDSE
jgi:hypothetical protein